MSEKSLRMGQRRRRYLARLRGEKKGVSPVVATLILILIAVAAAAALYLWLVVWQGNITGGIGSPHAQATLTVGGSTSVYPFSQLAATWFEQNNSDITISDNQGGTGAGMTAVCAGQIDIGASSTPQTITTLETSYGCPSQYANSIQITTIAYDAVDVAVPSANATGLQSINWDTIAYIYAESSTTTPTLVPTTINGAEIYDVANGGTLPNLPTSGSGIQSATWNDLPACVPGTNCGPTFGVQEGGTLTALPGSDVTAYNNNTLAAGCGTTLGASYSISEEIPDTGAIFGAKTGYAGLNPSSSQFGAYVDKAFTLAAPTMTAGGGCTTAPTLASYSSSQPVASIVGSGQGANVVLTWTSTVSTVGVGSGTPTTAAGGVSLPYLGTTNCGWKFCATGGKVVPVERSDASGTTQSFEGKILGATSSSKFASNFASLSYSGCGGNNLLSDCGISVATTGVGNPGVITAVAGNALAIGYASDGLVRTTGSGVTYVAFDGVGQLGNLTVTTGSTVSAGAIVPTTGATGTIAAGILSSSTVNNYAGWRPFQFVSLEPYTGDAQEFVTFIMDPANNAALASATDEVSVYAI